MSQPTQVGSACRLSRRTVRVRAVKPRLLLGAIGAAVIMLAPSLAASPAQASPSASSTGIAPQQVGRFHAFTSTGFSGPDTWFSGNAGTCIYVGDNWNDKIRSARTESATRVELWDNWNCTGGAIVIDSTGYRSIGEWVSAYRVSG